jgi:hypothetical protein
MDADIPRSVTTAGRARQATSDEPFPVLAFLLAVLVCGANTVAWLWFTSPEPHYLWNLAVPLLVVVYGGLVVPMIVFLVGGLFGLFKLDVYRYAVPALTHRGPGHVRRRRYYLFALLFTAAAMLSIMFHVPLYARFALSRPAMDAFVADVRANPDAVRPAIMRVGWYVLETAPRLRRDAALMFNLAGDTEAGFTYSATPIEDPGGSKGAGGSLRGGWYWYSNE